MTCAAARQKGSGWTWESSRVAFSKMPEAVPADTDHVSRENQRKELDGSRSNHR
jgi:hypothetical protein